MAPIVGYWNLRGLVMPIKYVLNEAGVEFEDKVYKQRESWPAEKFNLGFDFPNLPYYIDGDVKLTQSMAILKYVAKKNGLAGSTPEEEAVADMACAQIMDLRSACGRLFYGDWNEETKAGLINNTLPTHMKLLEKFFSGKDFVLGKKVSYADFLIWESVDMMLFLVPDLLKDYSNLKAFYDRVANLPKMKAYMASDKFIQFPLNGPMAKWGGKMEDIKTRYPNKA